MDTGSYCAIYAVACTSPARLGARSWRCIAVNQNKSGPSCLDQAFDEKLLGQNRHWTTAGHRISSGGGRSILSICLPLLTLIWLWMVCAGLVTIVSTAAARCPAGCAVLTQSVALPSKEVKLVKREGKRSRLRGHATTGRFIHLKSDLSEYRSSCHQNIAAICVSQQPQTPPARSASHHCAATGPRPTSSIPRAAINPPGSD